MLKFCETMSSIVLAVLAQSGITLGKGSTVNGNHFYFLLTITTPGQPLLVNLGLTADFPMPVPQDNVLFEHQFSVPMDLDPYFKASPPIVPSQGFCDKYIIYHN